MKKIISLAVTGIAILGLSGCSIEDMGTNQNIQLVKDGFTDDSYDGYTMVTVVNNSSYAIDEILTAKGNGGYTAVTPPKTVYSGDSRTFKSSRCSNYNEEWTIQVVNTTGDYAEKDFLRQCGYHEYFTVIDN